MEQQPSQLWLDRQSYAQWLMHFISTANPRTDNRVVLVSDSHYFHTPLLTPTAEMQRQSCKEECTNAQIILRIFRQPLHVSGVSRPIIRRYNRMYTTIGTYYSF